MIERQRMCCYMASVIILTIFNLELRIFLFGTVRGTRYAHIRSVLYISASSIFVMFEYGLLSLATARVISCPLWQWLKKSSRMRRIL